MASIKAFQGLVYNTEKIQRLQDVVAPPYDVISGLAKEELYARHPENVVRLILGKEFDGDNDTENKYSRARRFLSKWISQGSLVRDEQPALYLYNQEYESDGVKKVRKGYMAQVRLEEFEKGIILPHEATLAKPVEDRLKLFRATQCNLSPVFGLYADRDRSLDRLISEWETGLAPVSMIDGDGGGHEIRKLTDSAGVDRVAEFMNERKIILADGHHRYTTALLYKREMEKRYGPDPDAPYNFVMMYLTNMYGRGISVGAIHRLVHGVTFNRDDLLGELGDSFDVEQVNGSNNGENLNGLLKRLKEAGDGGTAFALYFGKGDYRLLKKKAGGDVKGAVSVEGRDDLSALDVSVVHSMLLEKALRISREEVKGQRHIIYKKDPVEAVNLVDAGEADMACLMNPTPVEQVESIAGNGRVMPQKSTFFFPKLLTGLVMSPIGIE